MRTDSLSDRFVKACAILKVSIDVDYADSKMVVVSFHISDDTTIGNAKKIVKDVIDVFNDLGLSACLDYDSSIDNPVLIIRQKPSLFDY